MNPISVGHNLELRLLGGFDARLNGHPVAGISYVKMRALLAYLAMEREQEHSREVLAELLWGDNDPVTARGNLRRTLSHLRSALEVPGGALMFATTKHSIRFIPDAYVDALEFNQQPLASAKNGALYNEEKIIGLYRGEFLAGLSVSDSPEFEAWLLLQREALHRRALALLEQLANHHAQAGGYGKALQFALRHIELEPWDEDAHRRVIRIYALNGQKNAAIRQYEICCRLIKQELGVLPGEETQQLINCIRDGELPRRSTDNVVTAPLPPPAEQRQVTVLYCELTVMLADDPDELMMLQPPQSRCMAIIRQFSG
ncbi:MAG: BTAD domain-containing putative transcriptional regulator, partial [Methylobacter sp.]|nr:BTAD domain-containing putative transcriptional regulator [Methylobacter sp.]